MEGKEAKGRLLKKGFWKPEEDFILRKYVETHGEGNWTVVSKKSGLMRGAKSCRLRWKNYLRPNIKRGMMSEDEKDLIIRLHKLLGNRWSLIAGRLPGRTDNEVKNYWNTHLNKKPTTGHLASKAHHQEPGSSLNRGPTTPVTTNAGDALTSDVVDSDWLENFKVNCDFGIVNVPPLDYETTPFMPILDRLLLFGCEDSIMQDSIFS